MTEKQREARGIRTLPANLADAIALTEKSALVKEALGDHVFNAFIENKKNRMEPVPYPCLEIRAGPLLTDASNKLCYNKLPAFS